MKNDDRPRDYRKDTLLTHLGRNPEANHGVVNPPVYHASTILSKDMAEWERKRSAPRTALPIERRFRAMEKPYRQYTAGFRQPQ